MIMADFTAVENSRNNDNHKAITAQRLSSQPSSSSNENISNQKNQFKVSNNTNTIDTYISQLNIPGVKQAYHNSQKYIQQQNLLHQTMLNQKQQHLNQSIQRLYSTGFSWKKKNNQQHSQESKQNYSPQQHDGNLQQKPKQYYNQLYQLDQNFDQQFRVKNLQNQCKQMYKELFNKFIAKYKIWVAENQQDKTAKQYKQHSLKQSHPRAKMTVILKSTVQQMFIKSVITFLLNYTLITKSNNFLTPVDEFTISYTDFLNHHKRRQWANHKLNSSIPYDIQLTRRLKSLSNSLPFIYYFLSFDHLQKGDDERIKNLSDLEVKVLEWLRKEQHQWENIYKVFAKKLEPKFTVPFQTKLYQVKKIQKGNNQNQQQEEQIQKFQPFKANTVPQSTYQKPPSPSLQTKKPLTQPEPFNFTHPSAPTKTANDYYSWDRNFKANPIPKTLYQPQLIGLPQKQKLLLTTQHKQKLYHQSKFPKTMNYLQNFNQYEQDKKKQLQQKYTKNRQQDKLKPKQIPDFQRLHKKDMHLLQTRKQMNRANTQPKPFKFTQAKKEYTRNTFQATLIMNDFQLSQQRSKQIKSNNISYKATIPAAKTTAKFDAYVQLRKQQKQQKQKQKQERDLYKKRQQQDKRQYKDILKQRMQNELMQQPKAIQYPNNATANYMVKVDLEEIYLERPLLMQGNSQNNNRKNNYDNKTSFTDNYEPII